MTDWLFDGAHLLDLRAAIRRARKCGDPYAELTTPPSRGTTGRLGLLPGSFNPPTHAHQALAEAAITNELLDAVLFVLSTHTIDKERLTGATLEDRLLILDSISHRDPRMGVLLVNRGLYVEQAQIAQASFPEATRVTFLVGFDKIVQIFDPRYYNDRNSALSRLFAAAEFLVAPREEHDRADLAALLARPENVAFRNVVRPLDLGEDVRRVSSSRARRETATGGPDHGDLPLETRQFIEVTGVYDDRGDTYERRLQALDLLEREGGGDLRTAIASLRRA